MYLIFGVLTTAVNWIVTAVFFEIFGADAAVTTIVAWIISVLFAYVTNKAIVFESGSVKGKAFFREMFNFFAARGLSGAVDVFIMTVFVDFLGWHKYAVKLFSQIFVIIFNYFASKYLIFKKQDKAKEDGR